jgi:hypothetical protein
MSVYITRWDDGTAHIGAARNKEDLMDLLDEVGSPTVARWSRAKCQIAIDVSAPVFCPAAGLDFTITISGCDSGHALRELLSSGYPHLRALAESHWEAGTAPPADEWSAALDADLDTSPIGWKRGTIPRLATG